MLVTASLSKRLYDRLGEELANDLVELLNQVDASSRSELRELNELNFARFDAKLEQRVAETSARIDKLGAELNARIDKVAAELNARIDKLAAEVNVRLGETATRSDLLALRADMEQRFGDHTRFMLQQFGSQNRFLYLAVAVQISATLGLWLR